MLCIVYLSLADCDVQVEYILPDRLDYPGQGGFEGAEEVAGKDEECCRAVFDM